MDDHIVFDVNKRKKGQKGGLSQHPDDNFNYPNEEELPLSEKQLEQSKKLGTEEGVIRAVSDNVRIEGIDEKEKGKKEGIKEESEEALQREKQANSRFKGLLEKSQEILMQFKTTFPFDFFPDRITIDLNKVTISTREFFSSEVVTSININEIKEVTLSVAGFLATLTIVTVTSSDPLVISNLRKRDALKARRILQGIIMASKENIQLTKVKTDNLAEKIEEIGKVATP